MEEMMKWKKYDRNRKEKYDRNDTENMVNKFHKWKYAAIDNKKEKTQKIPMENFFLQKITMQMHKSKMHKEYQNGYHEKIKTWSGNCMKKNIYLGQWDRISSSKVPQSSR